jgi:hypothetical protein
MQGYAGSPHLVARTAAPSARPWPSQPLLVCILQQGAAVIGDATNQVAGAWSLRSIREERFVRDREKRKTDRFFDIRTIDKVVFLVRKY